MNRDDTLRMAREAGFVVDGDTWIHAGAVLIDGRKSIDKHLQRFAALVAAAEQDRCCKIVFGMAGSDNVAQRTVDAIRSKK